MRTHTYWNEKPRDDLGILLPKLAIFLTTSLDVPGSSMHNHDAKEKGVEPWKRTFKSGNCGPGNSEKDITCIVKFASVTIYRSKSANIGKKFYPTYRCNNEQMGQLTPTITK